MANESVAKGPSEKVRIIFERAFLPLMTAFVAYYLLHGVLKDLAERLPPPYAEAIAHPIIDNILYGLLSFGYFFVGFVTKRVGKWTFIGLLLFVGVQYGLVRFLPAKRFVVYVDLAGLLWTAVILLAVSLYHSREEADDYESDSREWPWEALEEENLYKGMAIAGRATQLALGNAVATITYLITCIAASMLLGMIVWDVFKLSVTTSRVVTVTSMLVLASVVLMVRRGHEKN